MKLTIDTSAFSPSTLAAMIADMVYGYSPDSKPALQTLLTALQINAGDEYIYYLAEEGITLPLLEEKL